ncbi:MAG: glycosyltransferase family 39 protein, partial [Planctomycetes bacterium]|nr:glycosyltransferase family 39 protein [Planctomycetota bacterium]
IGLINHILATGDWIVPTLTGEPFMEKPPLFFLTAALFAKALAPWLLPMHQAAAMATVLYIGLTFIFTYLAGREAAGKRGGAIAMLGLMGCLGLVVRAHTVITDTALWSGFAIACYGMLLTGRRWMAGAFWFGAGSGIAFMSKGFVGPAFIGIAVFLLPVFCPVFRSRLFALILAWSFIFSLPWLTVWPIALYLRSPELFSDWFWQNNIGRFLGPSFGFPALAQIGRRWKYFLDFPWFTLPLWPPALALWWNRGRMIRHEPAVVYPALVVTAGIFFLTLAAGRRELYMIPLLIPLAVTAAKGSDVMPPWLKRTLCLVQLVVGGLLLFALWALWLGWSAGFPELIVRRINEFAPGVEAGPGSGSVVMALLYTGAWFWFFGRLSLYRRCWHIVWAFSLTVIWGTATLLFLPVLNHGNGYRATFAAMAEHLPRDNSVVLDAYGFGESQRAILEYYFSRRTREVIGNGMKPEGNYLLVQNFYRNDRYDPGAGWRVLWEGTRPGDKREWYVLYHRRSER